MIRRHTPHDHRSRNYSGRQRQIIITFDTIEDAEAWDRAGQPIDILLEAEDSREELATESPTTGD